MDPEKAKSWVHDIEKIFKARSCLEGKMVDLDRYRFTEEVEHWWRSTREIKFESKDTVVWEESLEAFNDKYFLKHV